MFFGLSKTVSSSEIVSKLSKATACFMGIVLLGELAQSLNLLNNDDTSMEEIILFQKYASAFIRCAGDWMIFFGTYPNGIPYHNSRTAADICDATDNGKHAATLENTDGTSIKWLRN